MERVFNLGIGMVAVVPGDHASDAIAVLGRVGIEAFEIGEVVTGGSELVRA